MKETEKQKLDELCAWLADQAATAQFERIGSGRRWVKRARASGQCAAYFHALAKVRELFARNANVEAPMRKERQ